MYAGHDSTVANFLMALKVWDQQIPTYNIMALVELHLENSVYGLKVRDRHCHFSQSTVTNLQYFSRRSRTTLGAIKELWMNTCALGISWTNVNSRLNIAINL